MTRGAPSEGGDFCLFPAAHTRPPLSARRRRRPPHSARTAHRIPQQIGARPELFRTAEGCAPPPSGTPSEDTAFFGHRAPFPHGFSAAASPALRYSRLAPPWHPAVPSREYFPLPRPAVLRLCGSHHAPCGSARFRGPTQLPGRASHHDTLCRFCGLPLCFPHQGMGLFTGKARSAHLRPFRTAFPPRHPPLSGIPALPRHGIRLCPPGNLRFL